MLTNVSSSVFTNSDSIQLLPVVSAEWNQNLFNPPYITMAGMGNKESVTAGTNYVYTGSNAHPSLQTNSVALSSNAASVSYSCSPGATSPAYKIITYVRTDNATPIMLNAYAKGSSTQFGSTSLEINSFGWTKVEVYMGGANNADTITSITFNIVANTFTNYPLSANLYWTTPEIYATQYSDYQYNSLWPTDAPFSYFRPGESYIGTGNTNISFPSNYRQVTSAAVGNFTGTIYNPVCSIVQNPQFLFATQYVPFMKNTLPTDISQYKYFVSDSVSTPSISAKYFSAISTNKIVLKFNTMISTPNISVYLNGSGTAAYTGTVPASGVLVLYYTGSAWTTTKWTTMPSFNDAGVLSLYTTINQITVKQNSTTLNSAFITKSSTYYTADVARFHVIEVSPRLEVDLTSYVIDVSINKQLDSKSTVVPLSTINTDDATVTLAGMPAYSSSGPIPIFSNQSNANASVLANMLRKNIKFYINWNLVGYDNNHSYTASNTYIPAGVFYSDSWNESDIDTIQIQCYDIIRYLQTLPCADSVSTYKTAFNVISDLLNSSGFTDYDIDSLYTVTNDPASPMDMSYFFANSKDTTVAAALTELFLAYQIGAYVDEYGIMKFLSLSNILTSSTSTAAISITDSNIYEGGYGVQNVAKVGKISLRYQRPKIKQTLALQNATNPSLKNSPSFIYTTSSDQVWISGTTDSVGFNYLSSSMSETANTFSYNVNSLLDQFHTFNLNNNGYVAIENEIVSFQYKEYTISATDGSTTPKTVSVKSDIELNAEVDKYVRSYTLNALTTSTGSTASDYNITISPTGNITNVKRGLFGTVPSAHNVLGSSLSSKSLSQATVSSSAIISTGGANASTSSYQPISSNPAIQVVNISVPAAYKVMVYPTSQTDLGYYTYSTKMTFGSGNLIAGGLFFNVSSGMTSTTNGYFVELIQNFLSTTTVTSIDVNGNTISTPTSNFQYIVAVYQMVGTTPTIISWADVTATMTNILNNFEKVLVATPSNTTYKYLPSTDAFFQLKATHFASDGTDGEQIGEIIDVFINNAKVVGWQIVDTSGDALSNGWKPSATNTVNGLPQLPKLGSAGNFTGTQFGAYMTTSPIAISNVTYNQGTAITTTTSAGNIRELYATQAVLRDRSTNYWWQTSTFLNALIQNENLFNVYQSYIMQTSPAAIGINVYDVQYSNPAATNVDILPVSYYQLYFPSGEAADNSYKQSIIVNEDALSYSTVLNTGFRAKFAVANNSPYMVWLHKTPDALNQTSIQMILWTHEIVAQSEPDIVEKIINPSNATEVAQIDSTWIQSSTAANRLMTIVAGAIDGFSKDTTLKIFGNPLVQLGDIVSLTYTLAGINQRPFVVQAVKHTFKEGLETELVLNPVGPGVQY